MGISGERFSHRDQCDCEMALNCNNNKNSLAFSCVVSHIDLLLLKLIVCMQISIANMAQSRCYLVYVFVVINNNKFC